MTRTRGSPLAGTGADARDDVTIRTAVARAAAGLPVDPRELPERARRAVALADRLGAPRTGALEAAAAAAADRRRLARAVDVAASEARVVARGLVLAPPVLGPVTALLVTAEPFAVWATPPGRAVLAVAAVLWLTGWVVVRALVRAATAMPRTEAGPSDELLELVAVALAAGTTLPTAVRLAGAATASEEVGEVALWLELGVRGPAPSGWEGTADVLAAARHDGVALGPLVRSMAAARRHEGHHRALQRAARLGARLTVPTTLLLLPAAGLLVVAPLLHGAVAALA